MTIDEKYMQRCNELALKGAGNVSPNPLVGCIIIKGGKIIAEGYHKKYGSFHAERNAINSAVRKGINLKGAELYVNLEPCSHYGKTPPCAEFIAEHKIKRVIIGVKDPNPLVSGKGIKFLRKNGIQVTTGVLETECKELNKFFFKFIKTGLPYITLKSAQTIDGKIANIWFRSKWISSPESRKLVHQMRAVYDAVLVGSNTVKHDNPELTVRLAKGRNPFRVIIDPKLDSGISKKMYTDKLVSKTIIFTTPAAGKAKINILHRRGIRVVLCKANKGIISLREVLKKLAEMNISSLLVEGGAFTYNEFIKGKLVDEFNIFIAPKLMGYGIDSFTQYEDFGNYKNISYYRSGKDVLINISK